MRITDPDSTLMMMSESLERLLTHAESLMQRIELVLPGEIQQPDWGVSFAYRYQNSPMQAELLLHRHFGVQAYLYRVA